MKLSIDKVVFIDTSAFLSLYFADDEFHTRALKALEILKEEKNRLVTSNFILDELYTWIRKRKGKSYAVDFAQFLAENDDILSKVKILSIDEQKAWEYFQKLPGRDVSFTDCTSFALMDRLKITSAFTFDSDFKTAGFSVLPK